jgi:S-adenosylmethionine decarboxylase
VVSRHRCYWFPTPTSIVTGFLLLAESHISIHTWPEHSYAAIDVFTCGDTSDQGAAIDVIKAVLKAEVCMICCRGRGG